MLEKLADYERMGIAAIWLIEPKKPLYYRYREGQLTPASDFELPSTGFTAAFAISRPSPTDYHFSFSRLARIHPVPRPPSPIPC